MSINRPSIEDMEAIADGSFTLVAPNVPLETIDLDAEDKEACEHSKYMLQATYNRIFMEAVRETAQEMLAESKAEKAQQELEL